MDYPVSAASQLASHLRSFRKARGLTQAELGALLGVKQARVADIERDPSVVSIEQLHKLLAVLGVQMVLHDTGSGWASPSAQPADTAKGKPARKPANKPANKGSW